MAKMVKNGRVQLQLSQMLHLEYDSHVRRTIGETDICICCSFTGSRRDVASDGDVERVVTGFNGTWSVMRHMHEMGENNT